MNIMSANLSLVVSKSTESTTKLYEYLVSTLSLTFSNFKLRMVQFGYCIGGTNSQSDLTNTQFNNFKQTVFLNRTTLLFRKLSILKAIYTNINIFGLNNYL